MSAAEHRTLDDRAAAACLAGTLARSNLAFRQSDLTPPAGILAPDDEAMLKELERSDSLFIDLLVEELWNDARPLCGTPSADDQESEEDRPATEVGSHLSDPAESLARKIVSDWASAVIESDQEKNAGRRSSRLGHFTRRCRSSPDYHLLFKLLDLDAPAGGDTRCCATAPDRQTAGRREVCDFLWQGWSADCLTWVLFLEGGVAPRQTPGPSRLWNMVDKLANTFRLETYDRENVLRILLGDFGKRVLFAGSAEGIFPHHCTDDWQNAPDLLKDIGASVIEYFREWSLILVASSRRYPSARLTDALPATCLLGRGPWTGLPVPVSNTVCKFSPPTPNPTVITKETRMPKLTIYPIGNADTTLIDLAGGQKILFDYANRCNPDDEDDKRVNLPAELRRDLGKRDFYDVVAFTHLDQDHYDGMTEFFYLEHDKAYQGKVDGKDRIKMNMMWVPAAVITEQMEEEESKVVQAEARYRLKKKKGIRVFSLPERLEGWLKENGLKLDDVTHLVTDAGRTIPGFTLDEHGVEFFVHSPFATRQDDNELEIRNEDALVVQATFRVDGVETKLLLFADINYDVINDIVNVTTYHNNESRLEWDIFKLAHHCSYTAIGPEKADDKTEPSNEVDWLFREQGRRGGIIVSTSNPIPKKGTKEDEDVQPPHRQAANYYREIAKEKDGEFVVTMEHPKVSEPKSLIIEIDRFRATVKKEQIVGAAALTSVSAPRAG